MKSLFANLMLSTAILFFAFTITGKAQTQTMTLAIGQNNPSASYNCTTNQIIVLSTIDSASQSAAQPLLALAFANGITIQYGGSISTNPGIQLGSVYTGVTNIAFYARVIGTSVTNYYPALLTFTVTTPLTPTQSSIPANAVVIPTDATGPVQIILESSSDLVNWTSSLPGTYGNTYSNRFFRVRAIAQ